MRSPSEPLSLNCDAVMVMFSAARSGGVTLLRASLRIQSTVKADYIFYVQRRRVCAKKDERAPMLRDEQRQRVLGFESAEPTETLHCVQKRARM